MKKANSSNALNLEELLLSCPMLHGLQLLSGRYKVGLLWHIHLQHNRFGVLKKILHPVTTKMLSQQLRELEADGLISRTIYAEMPPRVEYALTSKSAALVTVLEGLYQWGHQLKEDAVEQAQAAMSST